MSDYSPYDVACFHARETERFIDGEYTELPAKLVRDLTRAAVIIDPFHYLHISVSKPGMVAYTENEQKGVADRQTRVKIGKYLTKFHSDRLTGPMIAAYAAALRGTVQDLRLRFATTREECARVYEHGPKSCMDGPASNFHSYPIHPAEVYASGDTSVAYIERDGRITGRAVLNEINSEWTTIYGDKENMRALLLNAGYTSGDLEGCKLLRLESDGELVCPYLDAGADQVDDMGDYLLVVRGGEYDGAVNTNGLLTPEPEAYCDCCSDPIDHISHARHVGEDDVVCDDCIIGSYVFADDVQHYVPNDDPGYVCVPEGFVVHKDNLTEYGYTYDALDDEIISIHDAVTLAEESKEAERYTHHDNAVYAVAYDGWILTDEAEEYETVSGETRWAIDPNDDPGYRTGDLFAAEA